MGESGTEQNTGFPSPPIIRAAVEADLPAILEIYNNEIRHQTSIWNDNITDLDERRNWLRTRLARSYPVLVAVRGNTVLGYGSFGDFRPFDGYRFTVEHSLYVAGFARRQGIGTILLQALMEDARRLGKHVMLGGIAAGNAASLALHERLGFVETARMPQVGFKFERWLDLVFMQKIL